MCLVEEAHHLLGQREGGKESVLETCLREGREVGLGIILADQSISAISHVALANCFATVVLNCRQRSDVTAAAGSLLLAEEAKSMLGTLPVGQAIARLSGRWPAAVHIEIPSLDIPKGQVSDYDVMESFLRGPFARSTCEKSAVSTSSASARTAHGESVAVPPLPPPEQIQQNPHPPPLLPIRQSDPLVDDPDLGRLLVHVAQFPFQGVAARFDQLGLSRRKGTALKNALIELGVVASIELTVPSGKMVLLDITDAGREWALRHKISPAPRRGSLPHAYWQHDVQQRLSRAGWTAQTEIALNGHVFDVWAERAGQSLVIQVETGKSAWLKNLDALAACNATHKAVLWLDPASFAKAQLAVPSGIALLLPGQLIKWIASR